MFHSTQVRQVTISDEVAGQRIDNFLFSFLKGVPKTRVYRCLRKGEVRVNKGRIKPDYKLCTGDMLRIPPLRYSENPRLAAVKIVDGQANTVVNHSLGLAQRLLKNILYEDNELLILNKPAGVAVHGGSGVSWGVIEALRAINPHWANLELVHRLDRDTSGCLMIAKKKSTLRGLHEQLKTGQIEKVYVTLVKGLWKGDKTWAEFRLTKNQLSSGERIVKVDENGQSAVTEFRMLERFSMDTKTEIDVQFKLNCSLMEARPLTGRTHQIRVHAQALGYPIAGDPKYGEDEFNRVLKKQGFNRLFLHAKQLQIILPKTGETLKVVAPFDESLSSIIKYLKGGDSHG